MPSQVALKLATVTFRAAPRHMCPISLLWGSLGSSKLRYVHQRRHLSLSGPHILFANAKCIFQAPKTPMQPRVTWCEAGKVQLSPGRLHD